MSDSVDRVFVHALNTVKKIPRLGSARPPPADQIKLYGLYKQSTEGDVDGVMDRPQGDTLAARADQEKWDAWNHQKGLSKTEAKRQYVSALIETMHKYASATPDARELVSELEFVWDQIKFNPPSSASSNSYPQGISPGAIPDQPIYPAPPHRAPPEQQIDENGRSLRVISPVSQSQTDSHLLLEEEEDDMEPGQEEFVDAQDSQMAENESPRGGDGKEQARSEQRAEGDAAGGGGGGVAGTLMGPLAKYMTRPPKKTVEQEPDSQAAWHRRIESVLVRLNTEMAALREQVEMQQQSSALYSSILHPFHRQRRHGGIGRWLLNSVWNMVVSVTRHVFIDATLLALITLWMHFRGIPVETLEKHVIEFVHRVQRLTLVKKLERLKDWRVSVKIPTTLALSTPLIRRDG